jgi:signal peptidase I
MNKFIVQLILGSVVLAMVSVIAMYVINPFSTASYDPRLRIFGAAPFSVPSASMAPTLQPNDIILVQAGQFDKGMPKRNDVVVFVYPEETHVAYLGRVVAIGGDRLEVVGTSLKLNGDVLKEPFAVYELDNMYPRTTDAAYDVPEGHVFILGDNRDNSMDSRHRGSVRLKNLFGKVVRIISAQDPKRVRSLE